METPSISETKQLTGIEGNPCRKARIVRNPSGGSIETGRTLYRVKHDLLGNYWRQQLKSPTIQMCLA
jgi:hypothetical protein